MGRIFLALFTPAVNGVNFGDAALKGAALRVVL